MCHPSYGSAFIDGSHGQDGFMYVGSDSDNDSTYSDDEPENDS